MLEPLFQIKSQKETADKGIFIIEPLLQGYGHTLGNSLRRVLLSSIPGAAINKIKISNVRHRFTTLEGLEEDIVELILNIKKVRVQYTGKKPVKMTLEKSGPGEVKASDIKHPATVKIINKDLVLANLASNKNKVKIIFWAETGFGYSLSGEDKGETIGEIPIDALFSPIINVAYKVESTRVGRRTDFDRLVLEVNTDGTITPTQALKQAAQILVEMLNQVIDPQELPKEAEKEVETVSHEILNLTVEELGLPTRIANALRRGGYENVAQLIKTQYEDLLKVKNLGDKSIKIANDALLERGVSIKGLKKG